VVGGDYYDVLRVDGGAIALCIADVSGKGMPAALVMSNVQAGLRALITEGVPPARLLGRLNDLLRDNVRTGTFVTLFLGALDPDGRRLVFSNAGHNPPILMRPDGSFDRLFGGGPVLGVLPDSAYEAHEITVATGDRLVMYTDGLTERADDKGEEYGEARLLDVLRANRQLGAAGLRDAIVADVTAFSTSAFEDDLTVLVAAIS
jgi:sigma-B regulation protein RsbU (phosphoserine phosphatase)